MGDRESSRDLKSQSYQAHLSDITGKSTHPTQVRGFLRDLIHLTPLEDSWHSSSKPMREHGSKVQVRKIVSLERELLILTVSTLSPHFTCRMVDVAHTRLGNNMTQMLT